MTFNSRLRSRASVGSGTCDTDQPVAKATNDVRWTQLSAERIGLYVQAYGVATQRLDVLASSGLPARWAVILDIDETVLSNLTYQIERGELGAGYSATAWTAWVKRREATVLPGVLSFLARVRELGGSIALVSNRSSAECGDTRANLDSELVPYDVVLCRVTTSDKNARFRSVEDGSSGIPASTVVLFLGDNIKDFPALDQEVRFGGEDAYASFLSRFVLLPNPMYGSWETNTP